jgi:hypothetical protein
MRQLSESAVTVFCYAKLTGFNANFHLEPDGLTEVTVRSSPEKRQRVRRERLIRWRVRAASRRH